MNLIDIVTSHARQYPDLAAFITPRTSLSYKQLVQRIGQCAELLAREGICHQSRCLLYVPMSIELYILLCALWHRGASVVFCDAWVSRHQLDSAIEKASCSHCIGIGKARMLLWHSRKGRRLCFIASRKMLRPHNRPAPVPHRFTKEHTALVTFTTGSTGSAKGALRTDAFLLEQTRVLSQHLGTRAQHTDMVTLPIFTLNNLAQAATSYLPSISPAKPARFSRRLIARQLHAVDSVAASPVFFQRLSTLKKISWPKRCFTGGAPLYPDVARAIQSHLNEHTHFSVVYGSTEAEPISSIELNEFLHRYQIGGPLCAGVVDPHIQLYIIRPEFTPELNLASAICPGESVGEIVVSGPHVLRHYLNSPQDQARTKIPYQGLIWHRTGDLGKIDRAGRLWLFGRVQNTIGPENIPLMPIEAVLSDFSRGKAGTVIYARSKIIYWVEGYTEGELRKVISRYNLPIADQILCRKIPRDPRHNSKYLYDLMRKKLHRT